MEFYKDILCCTVDDLVSKFFKNVNVLSATLTRCKKQGYGMRRAVTGGNNHDLLVEYDSLPDYIKNQIRDPRKSAHVLEQFYKTDDKALQFYQTYQFEDDSFIDDKIQKKYITNASVLQAIKRLKEAREYEISTKGYRPVKVWQSLCDDAITFNDVLIKKFNTEHDLPANYRCFKSTYQTFMEKHYISLIKGYHRNSNAGKVNANVLTLLNNWFGDYKVKPTPTDISRKYDAFLSGYLQVFNTETGEEYNPKEFPKLSEATIRNYLKAWENRIGTYTKRSGNRQKLMAEFSTYFSFDRTNYAGSIISVDDRQPPFIYDTDRNRPWFYMAVDLGSEAITCWVNDKTKEGLIVEFYRQLVRNYYEWGVNLPLEIECEMSLNSSFRQTILQEGNMFTYVHIAPNNARAKRIERYFKEIRYKMEKEEDGWIARPNALSEANQPGPEQNKPVKERIKPYNQIIEMCLRHIEIWNNMQHSDIAKYPKKSRWDVFMENQNPQTKPINYRGILPHIGHLEESSVQPNGIIRFRSTEFLLGLNGVISTGDELINLLKQSADKKIDIYWLDANDGSVIKALVYIESRFICEAIQKPKIPRAQAERLPIHDELEMTILKYKSTIENYQRKQTKQLEKLHVEGTMNRLVSNSFKINRPSTMPILNTDELGELVEEIPIKETFNCNLNDSEDAAEEVITNRFL